MIDVHAPHESMHGWRDFLLHLFTITIGLLIALSLEGIVEWQHHRHLVHEAEASLHAEIKGNADKISGVLTTLHANQSELKHDVDVLNVVIATKHLPKNSHMDIDFRFVTFDNISWKTAQSTDALSHMPYDIAKEYAGIYETQSELDATEQQAARDTMISIGPFLDMKDSGPDPTPAQATEMVRNMETQQGQLFLVDTIMKGLDQQYKQFLAAHPN